MRLWNLAGRPAPDWQGKTRTPRTPPEPRPGVCALTGVVGPVFDARHVVSDLFTSWDRLPFRHRDPAGVAFSPPAAWAFRLRAARQQPHVSDDTALTEADPAMLHAALVALPDHPTWVDLPLNPVYDRLRRLVAPRQAWRVDAAVSGARGLDQGRIEWLRRGWPDLYRRLEQALPRLKEF